jgi:hypothetical protein
MNVENFESDNQIIVKDQRFVYIFEDEDNEGPLFKDSGNHDIKALDRDTYIALGFFLLGFITIVSLITLYFYLTGER